MVPLSILDLSIKPHRRHAGAGRARDHRGGQGGRAAGVQALLGRRAPLDPAPLQRRAGGADRGADPGDLDHPAGLRRRHAAELLAAEGGRGVHGAGGAGAGADRPRPRPRAGRRLRHRPGAGLGDVGRLPAVLRAAFGLAAGRRRRRAVPRPAPVPGGEGEPGWPVAPGPVAAAARRSTRPGSPAWRGWAWCSPSSSPAPTARRLWRPTRRRSSPRPTAPSRSRASPPSRWPPTPPRRPTASPRWRRAHPSAPARRPRARPSSAASAATARRCAPTSTEKAAHTSADELFVLNGAPTLESRLRSMELIAELIPSPLVTAS